MAVLENLHIQGIRSFGPNGDESVNFSTPLTLFLGENGCGKTTIIECLKFALTGELPVGSDGGKGFVNDPKLSNKISTKACVKLKFKDCKGDFVTVEKFIEVSTQVDGKLKFKSLNSSWEDNKGKFEDTGGKRAKIDVYCTQKLNVSKAIINNVIFCDQENSAWPLEEGKKVMKKFDKIFGCTEYNECVERLKELIKSKKSDIKVLEVEFDQKTKAKENTEELECSLTAKEELLQIIKEEIEKNEREMEPLNKRLNKLNELVETKNTLHKQLIGSEKDLEGETKHQNALKKHLHEEYEGTDEELDNEIANSQSDVEKQILDIEENKKTVENSILVLRNQQKDLQITFVNLEKEETEHLKTLEEMNRLIEEAKIKFIVITETTESISDTLHKLKQALKVDENNFNEFQKDKENEHKQLQEVIDSIRYKFAIAEGNCSSNSKMIIEKKNKKQDAIVKLKSLELCNSQIESVDKVINKTKELLHKKIADFDEVQEQHQLDALDTQIAQMDQHLSTLDLEYGTLQQNYVAEQYIDSKKKIVIKTKGEIKSLKQKHEQHFQTLFGNDLPQENMEQSVKTIQEQEDAKVKSITKNISEYERKVTTLESAAEQTKENLHSLQEELKEKKNKVESVCLGKSFADILKYSYTKKENLQKNKGTYQSAKTLFEDFINQFELENPCCPVCETDFSEKKGFVPSIIKKLKSKIEELPNKLVSIESELKKEEVFYNKLQQLKVINDNVQMLEETKIPQLEDKLHQNEEKLNETKMKLASLKNDILEPQNMVETCIQIIAKVSLLDRLTLDVKNSENSIESGKKKLVHVASNRTLDQTETERTKLRADLLNLRQQCKSKRDLYSEIKENIQKLNVALQSETQRKMVLLKSVEEQTLLKKQIEEYNDSLIQLEEEERKLEERVAIRKKELNTAEKNRDEVIQKNNKASEEKRLELDARKRLIDEIPKLHNSIERYENGESKIKLENVIKALGENYRELSKMEYDKKVLDQTIVDKKGELASQESKLRALKDNKELRGSKEKSKKLEKDIEDLRKQIAYLDSQSIQDEMTKVNEKIHLTQKQINIKTGEKDIVQQTIEEYRIKMNQREHKEAYTEFKKKFYELKVEKLAVEDLETYTQALENSILKFHNERMVQINMTIKELWKSIYRGNDIDYIEIKLDENRENGKKRKCEYKVVQVNRGVQMEMRGRCSAGQKVLACLVIRMALAETFSANCGILALDEPTTNLDADNIDSLRVALSNLITSREKQRSFQLLIITHDEEFLQKLTRNHSVFYYYKVQRNADGFSQIKKEEL